MLDSLASSELFSSLLDAAHHVQLFHRSFVLVDIDQHRCASPMLGQNQGALGRSYLIEKSGGVGRNAERG